MGNQVIREVQKTCLIYTSFFLLFFAGAIVPGLTLNRYILQRMARLENGQSRLRDTVTRAALTLPQTPEQAILVARHWALMPQRTRCNCNRTQGLIVGPLIGLLAIRLSSKHQPCLFASRRSWTPAHIRLLSVSKCYDRDSKTRTGICSYTFYFYSSSVRTLCVSENYQGN